MVHHRSNDRAFGLEYDDDSTDHDHYNAIGVEHDNDPSANDDDNSPSVEHDYDGAENDDHTADFDLAPHHNDDLAALTRIDSRCG